MEERAVFIYALIDPRDDTVHYVGQTVQPDTRLGAHITSPGSQVAAWLRDLQENGMQPQMHILETTDRAHAAAREGHYTARYLGNGPSTWGGARHGAGRKPGPAKITRLVRLDPATDALILAAQRESESYGATIDRLLAATAQGIDSPS